MEDRKTCIGRFLDLFNDDEFRVAKSVFDQKCIRMKRFKSFCVCEVELDMFMNMERLCGLFLHLTLILADCRAPVWVKYLRLYP